MNGPEPAATPHAASVDRIRATMAVSRSPQRKAAHSRGRTATNATAAEPPGIGDGPRQIRPTITARAITSAASEPRPVGQASFGGSRVHSTMAGVTTTPPERSPSHHVDQTAPKLVQVEWPVSVRAMTPIVALIGVAAMQTIAVNLPTPVGLRKARTPPASRLTSQAPARASSVLPAPMTSETHPEVAMLAAMAPARSAGQIR